MGTLQKEGALLSGVLFSRTSFMAVRGLLRCSQPRHLLTASLPWHHRKLFLSKCCPHSTSTEGFPWLSKPHHQWATVRSSPTRSGSQPYSRMGLFSDLFCPWGHCFSPADNGYSLICCPYFQRFLKPLVTPHHSKFLLLSIILI